MTQAPALPFSRSEDDRVVAGVCAGIAEALNVDATLVRFVFALLAIAGGAGILLYLALWVYADGRRPVLAVVLVALAASALLVALGLPSSIVLGTGLLVAGVVLLARRGTTLRPGGSLRVPGVLLVAGGAFLILRGIGASHAFVAPGAVAGALVLVLAPWLWQLTSERTERIRLAERAEVAARVASECFMDLDAPVRRVGALDTPVAYAPKLEDVILPQKSTLAAAIRELASF